MSTAAPWLFDLGNTRLKCAPLVGDAAGRVQALAYDDAPGADALAALLPARLPRAYVASVAGDAATATLLDALTARTRQIVRVRTAAAFDGLRIAYAEPARLGVDRFLALVAARGLGDVLVCGVGTALTVDLLEADGTHAGGAIAPSPTLMRQMLQARMPQLPAGGGRDVGFAGDTLDALASGCEGAALGLVERARTAARARLGRSVHVVLHGGGAAALAGRVAGAQLRHDLVLAGLARWAARDVGIVDGPRPHAIDDTDASRDA